MGGGHKEDREDVGPLLRREVEVQHEEVVLRVEFEVEGLVTAETRVDELLEAAGQDVADVDGQPVADIERFALHMAGPGEGEVCQFENGGDSSQLLLECIVEFERVSFDSHAVTSKSRMIWFIVSATSCTGGNCFSASVPVSAIRRVVSTGATSWLT